MSPEEQGRGIGNVDKQAKAAHERDERQQHKDYMEIVRAIGRIPDQLAANEQKQDTSDKKRRSREWITIILIFCTATLALGGNVIFYRQLKTMQLSDRPIIGLSPFFSWKVPQFRLLSPKSKYGRIVWNVGDVNLGRSIATHVKFQWRVRLRGEGFQCPRRNCGWHPQADIAPNESTFVSGRSGIVSKDRFNALMAIEGGVTVAAKETYRDDYGNQYLWKICMEHLTSGEAADCPPGDEPTQ